ncbi:UNVERIFIED_CONTAM: hypothetical protein FKN15_049923 [Acipenser sinensis]
MSVKKTLEEELHNHKMVQEEKEKQLEALQAKNMMLQQQIGKLKEHSSQMKELFVAEHANWSTGQEDLHDQIKCLEIELLEEQTKNEVLRSGESDLHMALQETDQELFAVKSEYSTYKQSVKV